MLTDKSIKLAVTMAINVALHHAEGREEASLEDLTFFQEYLSLAKKHIELLDRRDIDELLKGLLFLDHKQEEQRCGVWLAERLMEFWGRAHVIISPQDYLIEPLERWLANPVKDVAVEELLNVLFTVNHSAKTTFDTYLRTA